TRFPSSKELKATLYRYVRLYNHQIPQKALGHITPVQALKKWQEMKPELFTKTVYDLSGHDT
ncbi:MAG: IS481 family transposase, partial [Deltaproteobacteria bacterium]